MYQLIRLKDNEVIDTFSDEEKANRSLFFYDSIEDPHTVEKIQ